MILAEDLLLLLLDDESGKLRASDHIQVALGGAVLADLAMLGNLTAPAKAGWLSQPKIRAVGVAPDHPLLAQCLALVAQKPRTPQDLANRLGSGLKDRIIAELIARGVITERTDRALGVFPRTRWPAADSRHEAQVREAMAATLATGTPTDPRIGALIAIVSALGVADQVVGVQGLSAREVRKRAKAVAEGDWPAQSVRDALAASNAAMMAIVASTAAATTVVT